MIVCTICNETFIIINNFVKHLKNHSLVEYICPMPNCKRKFSHIESLRTHLNRIKHTNELTNVESRSFVEDLPNNEVLEVDGFFSSIHSSLNSTHFLNLENVNFITTSNESVPTKFDLIQIDIKVEIFKLIINAYNENSFSRKKILKVLRNCFLVFQKCILSIAHNLQDDNQEILTYLQNLLNCCKISTEYKFLKELNEYGLFTYPIKRLIKSDTYIVEKNNKIITHARNIYIQIIDLQDLFGKLFNKTHFLKDIICYLEKINKSNKIVNFVQSKAWKKKN